MPIGRLGPACTLGCGRPCRELGGLCTRCWLALTGKERALYRWADEQPTTPLDLLELWWRL